ncbi:MAG: hypothetical protein ABIO45_10295 [Burkholderiaceae bacterium]
MKVRGKDGEKTVIVPDGVPIVPLAPGDASLLVRDAKVIVTATQRAGNPVALRAIAGRNGFSPPM